MRKEREIITNLQSVSVPKIFSSREMAKQFADRERSIRESLTKLEIEKMRGITEVLGHTELDSLIDEGTVTMGIIKPQANQGVGMPESDEEATLRLIDAIGKDRIVFHASLVLSRNEAEEFYAPIRQKYESRIDEVRKITIWDSIINFASSDPLTFLLIYDEGGNAVKWWRSKMGSTNPDMATPNSIRGMYATADMLPNNLVHGSESKTEVKREVSVLKRFLEARIQE